MPSFRRNKGQGEGGGYVLEAMPSEEGYFGESSAIGRKEGQRVRQLLLLIAEFLEMSSSRNCC